MAGAKKHKTKPSTPKPKRAQSHNPRMMTLCVAGSDDRADQVTERLAELDLTVRRLEREFDAIAIAEAVIGIVWVQPNRNSGFEGAASTARRISRTNHVPVMAVVSDDVSDREVATLYAAGATAVFSWPRESLVLSRLVAETLGISLVRGKPTRADTALAAAVRARLRLAGLGSAVRISAKQGGIIHAVGAVDHLWKRSRLEQIIGEVPGVRGVFSRDVRVAPTGASDRDVRRDVRAVVRATGGVDTSTVTVSVQNGCVRLAGTIDSAGELRRLVELVAHVRGVRGIDNFIVVSPKHKGRDKARAKQISELIKERFPKAKVDVTSFGGVIVLSGQVENLLTKRNLFRAVDEDLRAGRVVDKVLVGKR